LNEVTNYALIFSLFISFESAFAQPGTGQSDDAKRFAGANAFGEYVVKEDYKRFKIASTLALTKDETRRTVQDISILIKKGIKDGTIPPARPKHCQRVAKGN
jgi:hypothetical protein